jgi:Zn-dependent protease
MLGWLLLLLVLLLTIAGQSYMNCIVDIVRYCAMEANMLSAQVLHQQLQQP